MNEPRIVKLTRLSLTKAEWQKLRVKVAQGAVSQKEALSHVIRKWLGER